MFFPGHNSFPKNDLYDLHLYQTVAETDHQFVERADAFIDVPIAAHVAFRGH